MVFLVSLCLSIAELKNNAFSNGNLMHADEGVIPYTTLSMIRERTWDYQKFYPVSTYPGLVFLAPIPLELILIKYLYLSGRWIIGSCCNNPFYVTIMLRVVVAVLSSLSVVYTYLISGKLIKKKWLTLVPAILFCFDLVRINESHFILCDSIMLFFTTLSVYWFVNKKYIHSAILAGLSFATKFNGGIFLILPATQLVLEKKWKKFLIALLTFTITFLCLNPLVFGNFKSFIVGLKFNFFHYQGNYNSKSGLLMFLEFFAKKENFIALPILLGSGSLTIWRLLRKKTVSCQDMVILFTIAGTILTGMSRLFYARNFLTIIPLIYISAAIFIDRLYNKYKGISTSLGFIMLIGLAINVPNIIKNFEIYSLPNNYTACEIYIRDSLKPGRILSNRVYGINKPGDGFQQTDMSQQQVLDIVRESQIDSLKSYDYVIISSWYFPEKRFYFSESPNAATLIASMKRNGFSLKERIGAGEEYENFLIPTNPTFYIFENQVWPDK